MVVSTRVVGVGASLREHFRVDWVSKRDTRGGFMIFLGEKGAQVVFFPFGLYIRFNSLNILSLSNS